MIVAIALGKANPISGLTARNNDLLDSQLACGLNHVVSTQHVPLEALVVRHQHVPRIRCEMYDGIDWAHRYCFRVARVGVIIDMEVRSKGVEYLTSISEVCLEGVDGGMRERGEVKVENRMTVGKEVRNYVAACFS